MRVNNIKVNTAIEKLDKLDSLNYGYYLDTIKEFLQYADNRINGGC